MGKHMPDRAREFHLWLVNILSARRMAAFLPTLCLFAYWLGGEAGLIATAVAVPLLWLLTFGATHKHLSSASRAGIMAFEGFLHHLDRLRTKSEHVEMRSAVFLLEVDALDDLAARYEPEAIEHVMTSLTNRLRTALRDRDRLSRTGDASFAIALTGVQHLDLETCVQLAGRFQVAIDEPIAMDGTAIYVSACVGFCRLARAPGKSGQDWFDAAEIALRHAQQRGAGSVRAYTSELQTRVKHQTHVQSEVVEALENGQIQPWFQPQISTDTGKVTGFEALARWIHPQRGAISPAEFLPAIETSGQSERLAEVMTYHTLTALKAWDAAGIKVPQVGVNFSGDELSNPRFADKIRWELDRFDIVPERFVVEILETVVAEPSDDSITRNLRSLTEMGCRIDLDDFGTGQASIASIRRFSVDRIKIDRSFVQKADRDPEQQRMISAILTMAERLGIETLAEGVETVGEHALLAQLGCNHVQGFGIARPMPFENTLDWVRAHNAKLAEPPSFGVRRSG